MAETIKIAGELESVATGGKVADVRSIKDGANGNKSQAEINAEHEAALEDRYTKEETYSKEQLNNLITTPGVQYVSVVATAQTTAVTDVLPVTGTADTIYRVGSWDGTQYDATKYSEYAWNGTQYVLLSVKFAIGEVYDISAAAAVGGVLTKYADLTAALGTNGANVPEDIRRGGLSIRFVSSSDNKYVQYRLMSDSFSTTVANWQGVDDKPTPDSQNLIKSGAVYSELSNKPDLKNYDSDKNNEFSICDSNGNVVLKIVGSIIYTKDFDSSKVLSSKNTKKDFVICDKDGNVIFILNDGNLFTKNFKSPYFDVVEREVDFDTEVISPIQNNSHITYNNFSVLGDFDFELKWVGGCLADNGRIYGMVNNNRQVIEINPKNNTYCLFGETSTGSFKWTGCGVWKNGIIIGYPRSANSVLVIDPRTQSVVEKPLNTNYEANHHYGGCIVGDKLYLAPRTAGHILVVNLLDWTSYTLAGDILTTSNRYSSVIYHPNGYIYFIPESGAKIIKLNPEDDSFELIGDKMSCSVFGATVAPNRCIYGFTAYRTSGGVLKIDVLNNDVVSFIGENIIGSGYYGSKLGLNGKIYSVVGDATVLWELNPEDDSYTQVGTIDDNVGGDYNTAKCAGGILDEDGNIYFIPARGRHIYRLNFNGTVKQTLSRKVLSSNYFSNY